MNATQSARDAAPQAIIRIQGASKTYVSRAGARHRALQALTLSIAPGEFVAILGRSGSGKSTLLNLIAGLDHPDRGTLEVAGVAIDTLGESALAAWRGRTVGIVFQFFQLLPTLTVLENVMLAMELVGKVARNRRAAEGLALLQLVGLSAHADKLPSALSGGEQQRAAIARALANDPPIVLADEPTGNLDSETAAQVNALFAALAARGKTVVIVTHDDGLASAALRIVRLRDGALESARAGAA